MPKQQSNLDSFFGVQNKNKKQKSLTSFFKKDTSKDKENDEGAGLSKQQMENLLEAVNNIEKDLNQKLKSGKKKVQTTKKAEKDW